MKPESEVPFYAGLVTGAILALVIIIAVVGVTGNLPPQWQEAVIRHKAGQYNPTSGYFEWIEPKTKDQ